MDRRQSALIRLIAWSITAVALVIVLVLGIAGWFPLFSIGFNNGNSSGYYYRDAKKYQAGPGSMDGGKVKDLDINWIDGSINIQVYEGDTVQFFEKSSRELKEKEQLHYYNKNGRLMIQYQAAQKTMLSLGKNSLNKELTVKIPKETAEAMGYVNVDTISSNSRIKGITADKMNLDSTSGDFEVDACNCLELLLSTTSGSLTGTSLAVEEKLNADTTSGSIQVEGRIQNVDTDTVSGSIMVKSKTCPDKIRTDSVSGDVELIIPENDGFTYLYDTVSGSLKCDFPVMQKEDRGTYKDGGASFGFDSVSGGISIRKGE